MGVPSITADYLYTALAAIIADGSFDISIFLDGLIACSEGFCTLVFTDMNGADDTFDIGFLSSTSYAAGLSVTASLPADPYEIATNWDFISAETYAFSKWWNPT